MAYIGRDTDKISNVEVLDNITFDGSSSYTLQKNSVNFTPSSANTLLVSIDGVVQAGNFTVSGSTIDFGTAVAGTSTCDFILNYGIGLITTPADGTVTTAKLADSSVSLAKLTATGTKDATTFLRGDNTFAEAGNLIKLTSTTISSNTSNIDFEDVFTSDYDIYKLFLTNVRPDTDQGIYLRFLTTGTTQLSSAEYNMFMTGGVHQYSIDAASAANDSQKNATQFQVTLWGSMESDISEGGLNAEITFLNPRQSTYKFITSDSMYFYTGGDYIVKDNSGVYIKNTSVMSGINIQPSSSNIASGILTLYGVKK
jgi:hypothetical protein